MISSIDFKVIKSFWHSTTQTVIQNPIQFFRIYLIPESIAQCETVNEDKEYSLIAEERSIRKKLQHETDDKFYCLQMRFLK